MGRPRRSLDATADAKAVRARLKDKDLEGWQRQRLQAVQLGLAKTLSLPQIAEEAGISPRSVGVWFAAFRRGGIEGLLTRKPKGSGPASWLDEQSAVQFKAELDKGRWRRAQDARRWLENKLGRKLTLIVTYKYLGKCEARLKVPRPAHTKKDPAKVEAFRAELCEKLHGEQIALETSVHLWVSDEMRFGLQPVTRRVWARMFPSSSTTPAAILVPPMSTPMACMSVLTVPGLLTGPKHAYMCPDEGYAPQTLPSHPEGPLSSRDANACHWSQHG